MIIARLISRQWEQVGKQGEYCRFPVEQVSNLGLEPNPNKMCSLWQQKKYDLDFNYPYV